MDSHAHHLLLISGLTYAATIQLHQGLTGRSATAMAKCLSAAHSIVRYTQTLGSTAMGPTAGRVGIVNPLVGVSTASCGGRAAGSAVNSFRFFAITKVILTAAGEALVHGLRFMRGSRTSWAANPALPSEDQLVGAIKLLLSILGNLSAGLPLVG